MTISIDKLRGSSLDIGFLLNLLEDVILAKHGGQAMDPDSVAHAKKQADILKDMRDQIDQIHVDDLALMEMLDELSAKQQRSRDKGRYGWETTLWESLALDMIRHLARPDIKDVAVYASMLMAIDTNGTQPDHLTIDRVFKLALAEMIKVARESPEASIDEVVNHLMGSINVATLLLSTAKEFNDA